MCLLIFFDNGLPAQVETCRGQTLFSELWGVFRSPGEQTWTVVGLNLDMSIFPREEETVITPYSLCL